MKVSRWIKGGVLAALSFSVCAMAQANPSEGDPANLIKTKQCGMCHKKDDVGAQYPKWQAGPHAKAYEQLASEEAKAVAAELGIENPQTSGACLKCHSTAYFFTESVQTDNIAVEDGVTCQSCHGAGKNYKKKSIMESREESIANGMVYPAKEKSCTVCHNDSSPTWKEDRYTLADGSTTGFDVAQAYEKIKHERPAE